MSLLRPVSPVDLLFLGAVGLLLVATLAARFDRGVSMRRAGVAGWGLFTAFWAITALAYLLDARYLLGTIGLATVVVAAYAGVLVHAGRPEGTRLTVAFTVMGLLFVPYEWLEPVHRAALDAVTAATAWGLGAIGLDPIVLTGPAGYSNVIAFPGIPLSHAVSIVSACSGISAVALFVGLIAATDATLRRRAVAALGIAAIIYLLNLVRTVFVAGALGGQWFSFAAGPVGAIWGVSDPEMVSYYLAEYVVAQVLVVLVLLAVYRQYARVFPELQSLVGGLTSRFVSALRGLRRGGAPDHAPGQR